MMARRRASVATLVVLTILLAFVLQAESAPTEKPSPDPVRGRAVVRHVLERHFGELSFLFRYPGPRGTLADLVLETTLGSLERGRASRRTLDLFWMEGRVSCCDRIEGREEKHRALARGLRGWLASRIGVPEWPDRHVSDHRLGQSVDLVRYVLRRGAAEDREWAVETLGRVRDGEWGVSARLRARAIGILAAAGESTDAASRKTVEGLMLYALQSPFSCGLDLWDEMPPEWRVAVLERAHGWMLEGRNSKIVCGHRAFAARWWAECFRVPEPRQRELLRKLLDSKSSSIVDFARDTLAQLDPERGTAWLEKKLEAETNDRKLIWLAGRLAGTESEHMVASKPQPKRWREKSCVRRGRNLLARRGLGSSQSRIFAPLEAF